MTLQNREEFRREYAEVMANPDVTAVTRMAPTANSGAKLDAKEVLKRAADDAAEMRDIMDHLFD
jgi:hypothetical protein